MIAKTSRNQPCPCSSGKKYKECCGKDGSGAVLNQLYDRYQLNRNNQRAVEDLFREIQDYARRILSKLAVSNRVTDDAVQTAMLNIWNALATFESRSKFSTWCYRIVRNAAIDAIRSMPEGRENFSHGKPIPPNTVALYMEAPLVRLPALVQPMTQLLSTY